MRTTLVLLSALLFVSCQNPITGASSEVDRAMDRMDRSVEEATSEIDQSVEKAQAELSESIVELRTEYEGALDTTSVEVTKLREDFKADIDDLESKLEERIEQVRSSALDVIAKGDAAAQARIDQLFTELRLFVRETLIQVKEMILPILTLAEKLGTIVETSQESIKEITLKLVSILEEVQKTFALVRETVEKFNKPFTGSGEGGAPGTPWEAIVALVTAAGTIAWKLKDKWGGKTRWNENELDKVVLKSVEEGIKAGKYDIYFRDRMIALGILTAKTHAELETLKMTPPPKPPA